MMEHERFETNQSSLKSQIESGLGLVLDNIQPLHPDNLGDNSEVYKADYQDNKVVIKLLKDDYQLQIEQAAFNFLGKNDIPVPKVFGLLPSTESSKAVIVESEIEGVPVGSLEDNPEIYNKVGKVLKDIHAVKIEGFGELEIVDIGLVGTDKTLRQNLERYKTDFDLLERENVIDADTKAKLEQAFGLISNVELTKASFLHNDFSPYHTFTDGQEITGIIDISSCYAGDPRSDVAYMQYHLQGAELEAFNKGYGLLATDEMMPAFRLLAASDKLAYRVERGYMDRIPEGVEILKKYLAEFKV